MFGELKDRKEDEDQMKKEGRLPPGQSLTKKFPVLHYGPVPPFNPSTWDLRIWGEVEKEARWTWDEFNKLPRDKAQMDIHCVTRWSKFNTEWEGVRLNTLVREGFIQLKTSAKYLIQHAEYGFTVNLPVEVAMGDNFLLATHFNGEPVTPEHGYPLRAIIGAFPGRDDLEVPYIWKGAKWLRGLEFKEQDQLGFWEQAGYHNQANVWKEQRFSR
ncbi:MAG: molybdopterin-dependent oxidoreductase [Anaerolineae bacterium]|nr:molybdopterin-dependent oxidoreductase [Anaerolineae bacterium]